MSGTRSCHYCGWTAADAQTVWCEYCRGAMPQISRRCQIKALVKELRKHPWHQTPAQVADRLERIIGGQE